MSLRTCVVIEWNECCIESEVSEIRQVEVVGVQNMLRRETAFPHMLSCTALGLDSHFLIFILESPIKYR